MMAEYEEQGRSVTVQKDLRNAEGWKWDIDKLRYLDGCICIATGG